ncbi:MAG TPA: hypothetical protein PK006_09935 [Saprospiraceae bacterium]|nr:hypothetical protein [Saprospiraceae bacterium]
MYLCAMNLFGEEFFEQEQPTAQAVSYTRDLWRDRLIAQDELLSKLQSAHRLDRIPHCSLFSGSRGSGQLIAALHLAQTILCTEDKAPCGVCDACHRVSQLTHPDLHFSYPTLGSSSLARDVSDQWRESVHQNPWMDISIWVSRQDKEAKQANITAAECRAIIEKLSMKPFMGEKTVLILWLPEFLGKEGNILLKLLEEPAIGSYIILATNDQNAILPTIISRSQLFLLKPIEPSKAVLFLQQQHQLSALEAHSIFLAADGNMSLSVQWAKEGKFQFLELTKSLFQKAYVAEPIGMLEWIDQFSQLDKEKQFSLFQFVSQMLSLCIRAKNNIVESGVSENEMIGYVLKLSAGLNWLQIEQINDLLDDATMAIKRNANIKIFMLDWMIQYSKCLRQKNEN